MILAMKRQLRYRILILKIMDPQQTAMVAGGWGGLPNMFAAAEKI
jgi:hypothetical protein